MPPARRQRLKEGNLMHFVFESLRPETLGFRVLESYSTEAEKAEVLKRFAGWREVCANGDYCVALAARDGMPGEAIARQAIYEISAQNLGEQEALERVLSYGAVAMPTGKDTAYLAELYRRGEENQVLSRVVQRMLDGDIF